MSETKLTKVVEGNTKLFVPDLKFYKKKEDAPIFYNPAFAEDRNLSVQIFKKYFKKARVADILCGLGARGVRYANECGFDVECNDASPEAIKIVKKNAKLNKVKVKTSTNEANKFLLSAKEKFDIIDIDPFGSPVYFFENSFLSIKPKKSMLAISATDLGALSGYYPKACFRKYGIISGETSFSNELGIRNLISSASMHAAKHEYALMPLFAYHYQHYYRLYLELISGKKTVNIDLKNLGYIFYCGKCEFRESAGLFDEHEMKCRCGNNLMKLGPTWISKLGNYDFMKKINNKFVNADELKFSSPYINLHIFSKVTKIKVPKTMDVVEKLEEEGYRASPTKLCGHAVKTIADFEEFRKIVS